MERVDDATFRRDQGDRPQRAAPKRRYPVYQTPC
jgi:hypothetical protein